MFQGKAFTSVEPGTALNDLCLVPDTGMLFLANEAPKILTYYIPVSAGLVNPTTTHLGLDQKLQMEFYSWICILIFFSDNSWKLKVCSFHRCLIGSFKFTTYLAAYLYGLCGNWYTTDPAVYLYGNWYTTDLAAYLNGLCGSWYTTHLAGYLYGLCGSWYTTYLAAYLYDLYGSWYTTYLAAYLYDLCGSWYTTDLAVYLWPVW